MLRPLPRGGRAIVLVGCLALLTLAGVVGVRTWQDSRRSELARAVALAPASAERLSWTDWEGVRRRVDADLDRPGSEEIATFLDAAFDRDLSTASGLVESALPLHDRFGFSPADLSWELLAQGPDGAVEILGFADGEQVEELAETLEDLGFTPPEDESGVWRGGADLLARIAPGLSPELQYFALLPDRGVVLTSDTSTHLQEVLAVAQGDALALESVAEVVEDVGDALAAAIFTGAYACEHLAMAGADATDRSQGEALAEEAGGVHPMSAFAMANQPDGRLRVSMSFESDDAARQDADARAKLAAGPAPGQGGDFGDRFEVAEATARGRLVRLDLEPRDGVYVRSDLTSGPVLFATC